MIMFKKPLASLLVVTLFLMMVMPIQTYAAPKWWERFKDIVAADIVGAVDGYLQTESIGGALGGSIKASVQAGKGLAGRGNGWLPLEMDLTTIGDLHNEGLDLVFQRFQFNAQQLSKASWERVDRTILMFIWEKGLYNEEVDGYLRAMNPTFEAIMDSIKGSSIENESMAISENFYANLDKALAILDRESDEPELLIDAFVDMVENGFVKETKHDRILANLMTATARKSYEYWKGIADGQADTKDVIIEGQGPEIIETEIPSKAKGLKIAIDSLEASVGIDPVLIDVAPFIENDRTMVPFRFVGESLGAEIAWNPEEASVTYVLGDKTVKLYIGKNMALVNGQELAMDENPLIVAQIVQSRTMVPVRFISEALGFHVTWDPENRTVAIHSNPYFVQNDLSGEMVE